MIKLFSYSAAALLLCLPATHADLVLGLQWTDGTPTGAVRTINNGDTLSVDMFLMDTDGSSMLAAEGLGTGGGAIFQGAGAATVTPASFSPNPGFDNSDPGGVDPFDAPDYGVGAVPLNGRSGLVAGFTYPADLFVGPVGFGLTNIPLATYALTFNGADGDTGSINSDVFDTSGGFVANSTFDTFEDLDAILTNFASNPGNFSELNFAISAAAVPEASTMLVGSLLLGGFVVARRRKQISASNS